MKTIAAVSIAAAVLAQAQQPPTFKASVDLVQVDVVVVDRSGAPVPGLTAADFVVRDRGRPQTIANFAEVQHERVPTPGVATLRVRADVANNQAAQAERLVVLVIDDLHIYKERTERTREIARKILTDLASASSMAVLFTSGDHSTQVTTDRAVLASAIESARGRHSWRRPHAAIDKQRGGHVDPEASMDAQLAVVQRTQDAKLQDFFENMTQYKLLQDAARMLGAGDARRKAFVLISEGIGKDLSGLFGAMASAEGAPEGGAAYAAGSLAALNTLPPPSYHDYALLDMMESLRRSNVATYAVDPRGKVEVGDLPRECMPPPTIPDPCSQGLTEWTSVVRQAQHGLEIMAKASGGFAITNTDDFTSGIGRILQDLDHYYLLGFYPADPKGQGYRPIDVSIPGRPDLTLRFRHGYMPGGPPSAPKNASEMVALSSGVLPNSGLPLRLGAIALPGADRSSRVALVLEVAVPRAQLEEQDGRLRDTLKYEVLVVDEQKKKVRSVAGLEAVFVLSRTGAAGMAPDVAAYDVSEAIDVQPGRYELRVSATSAKLGKGGSVYLSIDVPDFRAAPVLGGLALGYAEGARVPTAPRRLAPARRTAGIPAAARPELPFAPTLDRTFTARDTLQLYAEGALRAGTRPTVALDVLDAAGKVVRSPSPSFTSGERIKVAGTLPLEGLAPGAYILRVTLSDATAPSAIRESPFTVR